MAACRGLAPNSFLGGRRFVGAALQLLPGLRKSSHFELSRARRPTKRRPLHRSRFNFRGQIGIGGQTAVTHSRFGENHIDGKADFVQNGTPPPTIGNSLMTAQFTTAVVTGAGGGLGRGALCLARQGRESLAADVHLERAARRRRALVEEAGGATRTLPLRSMCPMSRRSSAWPRKPTRVLGRIDLVVNNAGVAAGGTVGVAPLEDWRWIMTSTCGGYSRLPRLRAAPGAPARRSAAQRRVAGRHRLRASMAPTTSRKPA